MQKLSNKIGSFKCKDEVWMTIHMFYGELFCYTSPLIEWNGKTELERLLLRVVKDIVHSEEVNNSVENLKQAVKYYVNDYHFEWEV
jgi:hypothetical protein